MNSTKSLGNIAIAIAATLVSVLTFAVHGWNRVFHHVVGLPTIEERRVALAVFMATLFIGYGVPFMLCPFTREGIGDRRWPIGEAFTIVSGVLVGVALLSVAGLIPGALGAYQDVIGVLLAYLAAFLAYSFAAKKAVANWRAKRWSRVLANVGVILVSGTIVLIGGWMTVFFE